jgi:type IV secretory pathway VirB2 component (pilin)
VLAAHGALSSLSAAHQRVLTGRQFFPELLSGPFHQGLSVVLVVATALSALAGLASLLRGRHDADAAAPTGSGDRAASAQRISA